MKKIPLAAALLCLTHCTPAPTTAIRVHVAASLRAPMERIAKQYLAETGSEVQLEFGASQTLLAAIKIAKTGDLFLPADDSYLAPDATRVPIAVQRPVLVVAKANPHGVKQLADLQRAEVRLALSNPEAAAIGKLTKQALGDATWSALAAKAVTTTGTITEAANAVKLGSADATFIFDSMLSLYPELVAVPAPELAKSEAHVAIALLEHAQDKPAAMRFARYVAARDKGLPVFKETGFTVAEGDPWAAKPELLFYSGSMLRPAIDKTVTDFEQREGVSVNRVYNGCGILVAQMNAGEVPDAYFACDEEFMDQVQDRFRERDRIAQNELVILVQQGNPHQIADLKDLAKPGLRIGIGHEKQCAMGWITQRTFTESGLTETLMKNVVAQVPTGDMLVNSMLAGSLDAAVVYLSNAVGAGDKLAAVRIQGIKCSVAIQPFAVAKSAKFPQLANRLHDALRSASSKDRFEGEGFLFDPSKSETPNPAPAPIR